MTDTFLTSKNQLKRFGFYVRPSDGSMQFHEVENGAYVLASDYDAALEHNKALVEIARNAVSEAAEAAQGEIDQLRAVCVAAKRLVQTAHDYIDHDETTVEEPALTALESALGAAGYDMSDEEFCLRVASEAPRYEQTSLNDLSCRHCGRGFMGHEPLSGRCMQQAAPEPRDD